MNCFFRNVLFLVLFSSFFLTQAQFSYEVEKRLVSEQFDSLGDIYGVESTLQKKIFVESICNLSEKLYTGVSLDRSGKFEGYLKRIARKVQPSFNRNVFVYASPYPNAFTIFRGDVFLHWGLIADAESEASLAYTLGHELGHFEGAHIYNSFLNKRKSSSVNQDEEIVKWHYEQGQEYYCDSIGFELASIAGYSWKSGLTGFYEYLSLDTILNHLSTKANVFNAKGELINDVFYDDSSDTLFSSHPPTASRIKMREGMGRSIHKEGSKNLVGKSLFYDLQKHARLQVLKRLLEYRDYKLGTIKAFKYYCLAPSNKKYKYYLVEFLRRNYLTSIKSLSYTLFSDVFKFSQDKSIYDNLRWIFRNKADLKIAKRNVATLLVDKGNTYNDLLAFLEKSESSEFSEFYLSMALIHRKNKVKKQQFIDKYLGLPDIKHADFGLAYKNDNLLYKLRGNKKKLFVFEKPSSMLRTVNGTQNAPEDNTTVNSVTAKKIVSKLKSDEPVLFFDASVNPVNTESEFIINELIPYLRSEVYSDDLAGGLTFSGSSTAQMSSPELWTYLYINRIAAVYINKNFMFHDETVTKKQDYSTRVNFATSNFRFTSSSNYYGASIDSYYFRLISFKSLDFSVSKSEEAGISKLDKSALKSKIKKATK